MKQKFWQRLFSVVLLAGMLLGMVQPQSAQAAAPAEPPVVAEIESELQAQLQADPTTSYWIVLREKADLSAAYDMDWSARGWYVMNTLQETANRSQANVLAYLDVQGVDYQTFWIDNVILVEQSNSRIVNGLLSFPEIETLRARRTPVLYEPVEVSAGLSGVDSPDAINPDLLHINVDDVWASGITGQGIVVGNIDTGVRYTHEALVAQYRGNNGDGTYTHDYNWYDPPYLGSDLVPNDPHNHGSHTMGTMLGSTSPATPATATQAIGMAPGAEWIACQGFDTSSGGTDDATLLACGQFMAAPTTVTFTNPNPDMRPNVVNNSWGDCGQTYDNWYAGVITSWHAAGIYPMFSNGNSSNCGYSSPPGLNTVGNPARSGNVTGVGATGESNGVYATYSNWGPTDDPDTINPMGYPNLKPQIVAPGTNRSSYGSGDTTYGMMNGTSMASPHVAGLVALMWSAGPCLLGDYAATETILQETAVPIPYNTGGGLVVPNMATGWGEVDALAAVQAAAGSCGGAGYLDGTVTESVGSTPLDGVTITAYPQGSGVVKTATTDVTGYYTMTLMAGFYTVTATSPYYITDNVLDVEIVTDTVETVDFVLDAKGMLWGYVTDADNGFGLDATVTADGESVNTDPVDGYYELYLDPGTYNVTATATDYAPETVTGLVLASGDTLQQDFALLAAVSFEPTPLEITLELGSSGTVPVTLTNNQPTPYDFEFVELPVAAALAVETELPAPVVAVEPAIMRLPDGSVDCAAYENYILREPAEVAAACGAPVPAGSSTGLNAPTDIGYAQDIGYISDNFVSFELGNFTGQSVVGLNTIPYYGMDFDPTATTLYALNDTTDMLGTIDLATGAFTPLVSCPPGGGEANWTGLSIDPLSGDFYGSTATSLFIINPATGASTLVGSFGTTLMIDIAINAQGEMYGHDIGSDSIYQIDMTTGAATLVGLTGYAANYAQGMDFDNEDGTLYIFLYIGSGANVYGTVNLTTGAVTPLATSAPQGEFEGATQTGGSSDVPWFAIEPVNGTVPATDYIAGTATFTATAAVGVDQPGEYYMTLRVNGDPQVSVPVNMTVEPTASMGQIDGTVTSDRPGGPLEALITMDNGASGVFTTTSDAGTGYYSFWLEADTYTVTASAPGYLDSEEVVVVTAAALATQDFELVLAAPDIWIGPDFLDVTLTFGDSTVETLTVENDGTLPLDFAISEHDEAFSPTAGEDVLVVAYDTTAATAMEAALTANGYTWAEVTQAAFATMPVADLLQYQVVFHAGTTGFSGAATATETKLLEYLDAGGSLYISDNDLGYYRNDSVFYQTYLQSTYGIDNGGELLTGLGIMAGINPDITTDPFPDDFAVGAEGEEIFEFASGNSAGIAVERAGYKAIYTSFDFNYIAADADEVELVNRVMGFLAAGDILWLSESPITATVPAAGWTEVDVTFDAGAVTEPGVYQANLRFDSNDPFNDRVTIPVTMTVLPTADTGMLEGTVTSERPGGPLDATLVIEDSGGITYTAATDPATGYYYRYLLAGTYTVTTSADGYLGDEAVVVIAGLATTQQDFELVLDAPWIDVDPLMLEVVLALLGEFVSQTVDISNLGTLPLDFQIGERNEAFSPNAGNDILLMGDDLAAADWQTYRDALTNAGVDWDEWNLTTLPFPTLADLTPYTLLIWVDEGTLDPGDAECQIVVDWLNLGDKALFGGGVDFIWDLQNGTVGLGEHNLYDKLQTTYVGDYAGTGILALDGVPGDLIGGDFAPPNSLALAGTADSNGDYANVATSAATTALLYGTGGTGSGYSAMTYYEGADYKTVWLGLNFHNGLTDQAERNALMENLLAFLYGSSDILWLSEAPITGTVAAAGWQEVTVTFDASAVTELGVYTAELIFKSNHPFNNRVTVPVQMTVVPSGVIGKLDGTVVSLGHCDVNPAPAEAQLVAENSLGDTYTFASDPGTGYYSRWLPADTYTLTVSAADHIGAEAVVVVTEQLTITHNFDLRWMGPCVSVDPVAYEVTVAQGYDWTESLDISSMGAGATAFELREANGGYTPAPLGVRTLVQVAGPSNPDNRIGPAQVGRTSTIYSPRPEDVLVTEGFEGGVVPPAGWTADVTNPGFTWYSTTISPHGGTYAATIEYDPALVPQDEWLLSPVMMLQEGTLSLWSFGSVYWCRDTFDNCDLNVWLVVGDVGGTDDILVGTADDVWPDNWVWAQSTFDLTPLLPASPVRIGLQYVGVDGAQISLDDILLDGVEGSLDVPWVSETPITGTVDADSIFSVDVTFVATATQPLGTYTGTLILATDDILGDIEIPLILHVVTSVLPDVVFTADELICEGVETTFDNKSFTGQPPATDWVWDFDDGTVLTTTFGDVTHTYAAAGIYDVTLEACNVGGCDTFTLQVEVVAQPVADFTYVANGATVDFTNASTDADTYLWDFGDGNTSTDVNPSHTYAAAGDYDVTLYAYNDCGMSTKVVTITITIAPEYNRIWLPVLLKN